MVGGNSGPATAVDANPIVEHLCKKLQSEFNTPQQRYVNFKAFKMQMFHLHTGFFLVRTHLFICLLYLKSIFGFREHVC